MTHRNSKKAELATIDHHPRRGMPSAHGLLEIPISKPRKVLP
jgi:hypothetical protein